MQRVPGSAEHGAPHLPEADALASDGSHAKVCPVGTIPGRDGAFKPTQCEF